MTEIHVDFRETEVLSALQSHEEANTVPIVSQNLQVGDIQIKCSNGIILIFERKTLADLAASVKDGRYKEQKYRLLSSAPSHHITYIIEGGCPLQSDKHGLSSNAYQGVFMNTMYRDGIHVLFVKDHIETAKWVTNVAKRCAEDSTKFVVTEKEYVHHCKGKTRKSDNITPRTCYIMQLCQVPGVSKVVAENIANEYPSMPKLTTMLHESSNAVAELCKLPMIGKKKAQVIYDFLIQSN